MSSDFVTRDSPVSAILSEKVAFFKAGRRRLFGLCALYKGSREGNAESAESSANQIPRNFRFLVMRCPRSGQIRRALAGAAVAGRKTIVLTAVTAIEIRYIGPFQPSATKFTAELRRGDLRTQPF